MQPLEPMSPVQSFIVQIVIGTVGAVPLGLLAALGYGGSVGWQMWLLGAVLVASWFPLRRFINQRVTGSPGMGLSAALGSGVLLLVLPLLIPWLWLMTITPLLVGILAYVLFGQNLLIALLAGLAYEIFSLYRQAKQLQQAGVSSSFFMNFQDFSSRFGMNTVILDEDAVVHTHEEMSDDGEPDVIYHLSSGDTESSSSPDKAVDNEIVIDPDSRDHQTKQD